MKTFNHDRFYACTSVIDLARYAIDQPHIADFIPQVITADTQFDGRGRSGHVWWSPESAGLYAAFIISLDEYHEFMTMWIGSAVVRELRQYTHLDIKQIGINDIYLDNRKLGGILCEVYKGYLVVGIGLNIIRPLTIIPELENKAVWLDEFSAERLLARADLLQILAEAIIT